MNKSSKAVKRWRDNTKKKIVQAMGGCCQICKYDKCYASLDLHHINPEEKEFALGKIMAQPAAWHKIVEECKKCILVCSNCHREIHNGVTSVPEIYKKFDESLIEKQEIYNCKICGTECSFIRKTCSRKCAAKLTGTIDWNKIDVVKNIDMDDMTFTEVADKIGCSCAAVSKRYHKIKKLGLV